MIKTNLITGFLGSGKTTTLLHLLKNKPEHEKWAILVNEFGEIGIDGALLSEHGATIKEIVGGCLCCVNGLSMHVGLNMLIQQSKPDRLLIEPTGLGHPQQIIKILNSIEYQSVLELKATLCLLDARQLALPQYYENINFSNQLAVADIIVANKSDCYKDYDFNILELWGKDNLNDRKIVITHQGEIETALLDDLSLNKSITSDDHLHKKQSVLAAIKPLENNRWRRALNYDQNHVSCGWVFDAQTCFNTNALLNWVRETPTTRIKGVMRIKEGTLIINRQGLDLRIETRSTAPLDSRIELIHHQDVAWNSIQTQLLAARLD